MNILHVLFIFLKPYHHHSNPKTSCYAPVPSAKMISIPTTRELVITSIQNKLDIIVNINKSQETVTQIHKILLLFNRSFHLFNDNFHLLSMLNTRTIYLSNELHECMPDIILNFPSKKRACAGMIKQMNILNNKYREHYDFVTLPFIRLNLPDVLIHIIMDFISFNRPVFATKPPPKN